MLPFPSSHVRVCMPMHSLPHNTYTHPHTYINLSFTLSTNQHEANRSPLNLSLSSPLSVFLSFSLCELPVSYHHDSWSGQPVNVTQCSPSAQAQKVRNGKKKKYKRREKKRGCNAASLSQLEECKHVSAQKTTLQHADKHTRTHTSRTK